jgi:hypothetical protein
MDTIMSTVEEVSTYEEGIEEAIMWFVTDMIDKIDHDNDDKGEKGVVLEFQGKCRPQQQYTRFNRCISTTNKGEEG